MSGRGLGVDGGGGGYQPTPARGDPRSGMDGPCARPERAVTERPTRDHTRMAMSSVSDPCIDSPPGEVGLRPKSRTTKAQPLAGDHLARGSMKTAANCVSVCESQEDQIHRQVERTLRRRP